MLPGLVGDAVKQTAAVVSRIPPKMVGVVQAAFGAAPRDPNGPISLVGIGRVAGEAASAEPGGGVSRPTMVDRLVTCCR